MVPVRFSDECEAGSWRMLQLATVRRADRQYLAKHLIPGGGSQMSLPRAPERRSPRLGSLNDGERRTPGRRCIPVPPGSPAYTAVTCSNTVSAWFQNGALR